LFVALIVFFAMVVAVLLLVLVTKLVLLVQSPPPSPIKEVLVFVAWDDNILILVHAVVDAVDEDAFAAILWHWIAAERDATDRHF